MRAHALGNNDIHEALKLKRVRVPLINSILNSGRKDAGILLVAVFTGVYATIAEWNR